MNVLFDELGWEGSAFMQYTDTVMDVIPIIHSSGYYVENGNFTAELSVEGRKLLNDYKCVQYYLNSKK